MNFTTVSRMFNGTVNSTFPPCAGDSTCGNVTFPDIDTSYIAVRYHLNKFVIPYVCTVGFMGNLLTMVVLTHSQYKRTVTTLEKSTHLGLIALAISDLSYCTIFLANFLWPERFSERKYVPIHPGKDFWYYRELYINAVSGTAVSCSTLITVVIAFSRYTAICFPMVARESLSTNKTKILITLSVLLAIALNAYKFFTREGEEYNDVFWIDGTDFLTTPAYKFLDLTHAVFSIFLPILALIFFNITLSKALVKYTSPQRAPSFNNQPRCNPNKHHRLTLTLIIIILIYLIGVAPQLTINFATGVVTRNRADRDEVFFKYITNIRIALPILKMIEACALSLNFALYCSVNIYFRKAFKNTVLKFCKSLSKSRSRRNSCTSRVSRQWPVRQTSF